MKIGWRRAGWPRACRPAGPRFARRSNTSPTRRVRRTSARRDTRRTPRRSCIAISHRDRESRGIARHHLSALCARAGSQAAPPPDRRGARSRTADRMLAVPARPQRRLADVAIGVRTSGRRRCHSAPPTAADVAAAAIAIGWLHRSIRSQLACAGAAQPIVHADCRHDRDLTRCGAACRFPTMRGGHPARRKWKPPIVRSQSATASATAATTPSAV